MSYPALRVDGRVRPGTSYAMSVSSPSAHPYEFSWTVWAIEPNGTVRSRTPIATP